MIIRNKSKRYTVIPNHVFEDVNKARALGVICYILTKPESFKVRLEHIKKKFGIGRDVMRDIMKYLASLGYAYLEKRPGKDGSQWIVTDTPFEFPDRLKIRPTENPTVGKPVGIISTDSLTNTDKEKEKNTKKDSAASSEASSLLPGDNFFEEDSPDVREKSEGENGDVNPPINVITSSFPSRTSMKHFEVASAGVEFYMEWVKRYPDSERDIQRTVSITRSGKVTDLVKFLMRQVKNGTTLDELKGAIAWKASKQSQLGFYRNIKGTTILKSKLEESIDSAYDEGWIVDGQFTDKSTPVERPKENELDSQSIIHYMNQGMSRDEAEGFVRQYGGLV